MGSNFPVGGVKPPLSYQPQRLAGSDHEATAIPDVPTKGGPWAVEDVILALEHQAHAGSCAAFAVADPIETLTVQETGAIFNMSEMDLYDGGRRVDGMHREDGGMFLASAYRWLELQGCVSEMVAPYNADLVTSYDRTHEASTEAAQNRIGSVRVMDVSMLLRLLSGKIEDLPATCVSFIHPVDPSYFTDTGKDGFVRPLTQNPLALPWHAQSFGYYDLDIQVPGFGPGAVLARNHWNGWGIPHPLFAGRHDHGYSWWPLEMIANAQIVPEMIAPTGFPNVES